MYQPLIKFHPYPAIITQVLRIFEVNLQYTFARCEKYSSKLDIWLCLNSIRSLRVKIIFTHSLNEFSRSLIRIFD